MSGSQPCISQHANAHNNGSLHYFADIKPRLQLPHSFPDSTEKFPIDKAPLVSLLGTFPLLYAIFHFVPSILSYIGPAGHT